MSGRSGWTREAISLERVQILKRTKHETKMRAVRLWDDLTSPYDGDEDRACAFDLVRESFPHVTGRDLYDFIPRFGLRPDQRAWLNHE